MSSAADRPSPGLHKDDAVGQSDTETTVASLTRTQRNNRKKREKAEAAASSGAVAKLAESQLLELVEAKVQDMLRDDGDLVLRIVAIVEGKMQQQFASTHKFDEMRNAGLERLEAGCEDIQLNLD